MKWLILVSLLFCACLFLDIVIQPSLVTIGERFTITITGSHDSTYSTTSRCWLAMMLPNGFFVDSIRFVTSDSFIGLITEIDSSLCDFLNYAYPCDPNTCWFGFSTQPILAETCGTYLAIVYVRASNLTIPGQYLVDYYSGDHSYGIWVRDSILNQPLTVNPLSIAQENILLNNKKLNAYPNPFRKRLMIHSETPGAVSILAKDGRHIRTIHVHDIGFWDGRDESGKRVSSGTYYIKGRDIRSKVILMD